MSGRKVALVTGGTRGIGLGIAECLAAEGFAVAVSGRRPAEQVEDALGRLRDRGAEALYCPADVVDPDARRRLLATVEDAWGPPNVLVNNAGVAPKRRTDILETTEESYDFVMGVNLKGPYFLTQAVAGRMIEARERDASFAACIVNVGSVSATVASPSRGEYCLSKAGIAMATRLFAARLGEYGIPVYEVRPGVIRTDMTAAVEAKYDRLLEEGLCLQKRWGTPEDVGRAVGALARGDFAYSTGQVVLVDGGLTVGRL